MVRKQLPALPECVTQARHLLDAHRADLPAGTLADYQLLVTEVVTNVIRHGPPNQGPMTLNVDLNTERIVVEVAQDGPVFPIPVSDGESIASGWGLRLLDQLATAWGVEDRPTTVWFRLEWPNP